MRKLVSFTLGVMLIFTLAACGGRSGDPILGTYEGVLLKAFDGEYPMTDVFPGENKLELMPRKNGMLTLNGSSASVDWALRGNRDFTITLEGIDSHGTLVNGVIVITYMDLGVKLTFEKADR